MAVGTLEVQAATLQQPRHFELDVGAHQAAKVLAGVLERQRVGVDEVLRDGEVNFGRQRHELQGGCFCCAARRRRGGAVSGGCRRQLNGGGLHGDEMRAKQKQMNKTIKESRKEMQGEKILFLVFVSS